MKSTFQSPRFYGCAAYKFPKDYLKNPTHICQPYQQGRSSHIVTGGQPSVMVLQRGPGTCKSFLQQPRRSTISNRQGDFSRKCWTFSGRAEGGERKWRKVRWGLIESWTLAWWRLRGGQSLVGCFMGLFIGNSFSCEKRASWQCLGEEMGVGEALNICIYHMKHHRSVFVEWYMQLTLLCSNNPLISWSGFMFLNGY